MSPVRLSRSIRLAAVIAALAGSATAHAQPTPADPSAEARRLFEEGTKSFQAGDYPRAEEAFEGSYAVRQSFDTAVNLGITEAKLGKPREAAEHFDFATRNFPPSESQENKDRLAKLLSEAKGQVVSLRITASVDGASVVVNGHDVGKTPLAGETYADPGRIAIRVEAKGFKPETRELEKGAGLSEAVSVQLAPVEASSRPIWPPIVMGSVGAVGLGIGIAGFVLSATASSDADALAATYAGAGTNCAAGCDELQAHLDDVASFRAMGIVGVSGAGAGLVGALVYALLPAPKQETAVVVVPLLGPTQQGLMVRGSF